MHLYLSSYELGNRSEELSELVVGNKQVGVIRNALDFSNEFERLETGRKLEFSRLQSIGLTPQAIDLRDYFFDKESLKEIFNKLDALWVVGGNTFILRKAFRQSGLEELLIERLTDNSFVYAGYSAGACVMTPSLRGVDLMDEPNVVPENYQEETIWEGLSFVPFCIAPHYRSNHPESEMCEKTVQYFIDNNIKHITLRDGDVHISEVFSLSDNPTEKRSPT